MATGENDKSGGSEHDPNKCPHRANDSFQQIGSHDLHVATPAFDFVPRRIVLIDAIVWRQIPVDAISAAQKMVRKGDPPSFSQVYCVYTI